MALDRIVHPRVQEDFNQWALEHGSEKYVIEEAALLLDQGANERFDYMVAVLAPEALRIKRVRERDPHRPEQEIRDIIKSQVTDEALRKHSDFCVVNDETCLALPQVLDLHRRFLEDGII